MSKSFYITTPIYYPNAAPHVGTAYTTIICDVVARYKRLTGYDVKFLTGVDEHGQKIQEAAEKNGFTPQKWVDKMSLNFLSLWKELNISNTDFIRTTQDRHKNVVKEIIRKVNEKGDIYRGEYIGKYSVSEETFVPENQLINGKYMGKEVIDVKEVSYFFKLSKYQDALLKHIEENPDFIKPEGKKNEVVSFIKQGLQDLSISRTTFDWGIPLELEEGHVIYVWFDALTNYLTAAGYSQNSEEFENIWTNGIVNHVIGKDILRFHAIIWPAILMSAEEELPNTISAHGWWTVEGEKMSKSLGNVINPLEEIKKYGLDSFRYYLMREATFGQDADYSKKAMIQRINSDLANDLGNLLNRTIGMQKKYFNLDVVLNKKELSIDEEIKSLWEEVLSNLEIRMNNYQFSEALKEIWKFIARMNKYIDENEPWNLFKDKILEDRLSTVMYNLVESLYKIAILIYPFMPDTAKKIVDQLGLNIDFDTIKLEDVKMWGIYPVGNRLNEAVPIFPRLEIEEEKKEFNDNLNIENPITIEDFLKIEIKVVEIIGVSRIEGADKLLKLIVNTGKEKRQIISGIAKYYINEAELIGKKVLAVLNLEPVELKNEISQGMLLTTSEKKKVKLIEVNEEIKLGTIVK
ncbi:MAG: methionine--tRNA ligase [Leptotrichiaceae bacterium]|nr:methionine--tRNA ligase [Leptotrichiaceae bacterium]MBP6280896.1 methionine--tRNA ligase [Leptotrichiaceae bacterium]MBP7100207.1 methionine--tRNA ligase [Leptotrichiaceae bacterium]MBP7739602.1 methionine--tRNA ligase [Leptotrichiaceae bacterium]MBP9630235.1 methionine--tRNA ligase [Leptotrichiaceae bacterium]